MILYPSTSLSYFLDALQIMLRARGNAGLQPTALSHLVGRFDKHQTRLESLTSLKNASLTQGFLYTAAIGR